MKKTAYFLLLLLLIGACGCRNRKTSYPPLIRQAEYWAEACPDSAIACLDSIDASLQELTEEELAARPMTPVTRDRYVPKSLKAYASMVSSADKGAVRLID